MRPVRWLSQCGQIIPSAQRRPSMYLMAEVSLGKFLKNSYALMVVPPLFVI